MGLKKGQCNNPSGRPKKGTTVRTTPQTKAFIERFLKYNRKQLQRDWYIMTAYQRTTLYEKMLSYVTPKPTGDDFDLLTDDQLEQLFERLKNVADERKRIQG